MSEYFKSFFWDSRYLSALPFGTVISSDKSDQKITFSPFKIDWFFKTYFHFLKRYYIIDEKMIADERTKIEICLDGSCLFLEGCIVAEN